MALPIRSAIDLNNFELLQALLENLTANPGSPAGGRIVYRSDLGELQWYDGVGAAWRIPWHAGNDGAASGLDADLLDGQEGSYYLARANHTGTQAASTISDFAEAVSDQVGTMVTGNTESGISVTYDDADNTLDFTVSDSPLLQGQNGAYYLNRANHTGTQLHTTISDFDAGVQTNRLDQMAAPTAAVSMNSQKITNLATPTADTDAATKAYVDGVASGLDIKESVRVATTTNITLSGTQTIDGVGVIAGDRVLVKNQTTASQNGIYVVAAGAWSRSTDADVSAEVTAGMFTFVEAGTVNGDTGWVLTTDNPITLGTTSLTFTQFAGGASISAGAGLTLTGTVLDVVAANGSITVNADSIQVGFDATVPAALTPDIAGAVGTAVVPARRDHVHNVPAAAPSANLTATTTNAEGTGASFARNDHSHAITANVTPTALTPDIAAAVGTNAALARADHVHNVPAAAPTTALSTSTANAEGTGSSFARNDHTHAVTGGAGGFARVYAANVGDGSATSITVTHNLGTKDVQVWVYDNTTPFKRQMVDIEHATTNTVTLLFGSAPTTNQYRVVVIG